MKRRLMCGLALVGLAMFVVTSGAQPPDQGNRKSSERGGPAGPPPRFQMGQVLSPSVRSRLKLTGEQEQRLADLEREVKERLAKILTPQQMKQLKEMRLGPGGPDGGPGGPGGLGGGPGGPGDFQGPPPGPPPGGFGPGGPGQDAGPGGFGRMARASTKATGVDMIDGGKQRSLVQQKDVAYRATKTNESAILLTGGAKAELTNVTATKSGDSSSEGESNFSGLNAVVLANGGSTLVIQGGEFSSDADGANGFFACGKRSEITVNRATFRSTKGSSRGLDATTGGKVTANRSVIETDGAHCADLATDRGGGLITANDCTGSTRGEGSPCIYSTGDIRANDSKFIAYGSEAAVIEGRNSITLKNTEIEGYLKCGVMLYQSFSGDAEVGMSVFDAQDSKIISHTGPMFYVTNTRSKAHLRNTALEFKGASAAGPGRPQQLILAQAGRWGIRGRNGGKLEFSAEDQKLCGNIDADAISTISLFLGDKAELTGAINTSGKAKAVNLMLKNGSTWSVAADSKVSALDFGGDDVAQGILRISGKSTVTYDAAVSPALSGKTYALAGGGKLVPASNRDDGSL